METQIQSFYPTSTGVNFISIFGYSSKGVPGLEINGMGKFGKNLKEKIIYINRMRKIKTPVRRVVISLDANDLDLASGPNQLKWLELPALLAYWHLVGAVKVSSLEDCLCSGEVKVNGEIIHLAPPENLQKRLPPGLTKDLKLIQKTPHSGFFHMDSSMFLEAIPGLSFRTYMDRVSETPIKSIIA